MSDPIDELGAAVRQHLGEMQGLLNDLAQYLNVTHPAVGQDSRIADFINLLQAGTSALADAHAKMSVDPTTTPPGSTSGSEIAGTEQSEGKPMPPAEGQASTPV